MPDKDRISFQKRADELYANGDELWKDSNPLLQSMRAAVEARTKVLKDKLGEADSPASRLAFEGLNVSDASVAMAAKAVETATDELIATYKIWESEAKGGREAIKEALDEITRNGTVPTDVPDAVNDVVNRMTLPVLICTYSVGEALVLHHVILVEVHNANARYLGRKEYLRSKNLEAALTILEGAGHDALHAAVVFGAVAAGVAVPHVILLGTVLATGKIIYDLMKSQVEEARRAVSTAIEQFDKLYALQTFNEKIAAGALATEAYLRSANANARQHIADFQAALHRLRVARLDIDTVLGQAADLQRMKEVLAKWKELEGSDEPEKPGKPEKPPGVTTK
jgi:hypothetical protein